MKNITLRFWIVFVAFLGYGSLGAQVIDSVIDKLADHMEDYGPQASPATLFVHFDKTIYTPNENAWFTGYLLRNMDESGQDFAMAVALVRNADRSVLAAGKFVLYSNTSFGNLFLPDSLPTGNYTMIAYTNVLVNGYPRNVFMQPVTIKSAETKIVASLQLIDSVKEGIDSVRVLLNARTKDITMIAGARVKYWLGEDSLHGVMHGQVNTDRKGDAFIMIPVKQVTRQNFVLTTQLQYGKETKTMRLRLPVYKGRPVVKFYPEGGNIVHGINNVIACEITNAEGEPLAADAVLYKNSEAIQRVKTNTYGVAKFLLDANIRDSYSIKLMPGNDTDQYQLPAILPSGTSVSISDAIVEDTLHVQLTNTYAGRLTLLLHNYKKIFTSTTVDMLPATTRRVIFALNDLPRGLLELTVLDSMGMPVAGRLFFAHYSARPLLSLAIDSSEYNKRSKVQVRIKLATRNGGPRNGVVSFACVQDNRFAIQKMMDIESYLYFVNELSQLSFKKNPMEIDAVNRQYLNDILLVKGWRRYTWKAMAAAVPDTIVQKPVIQFTGNVISIFDKKIRKPLQVGLLKHGSVSIIETDSAGNFHLTPEQTLSDTARNMLFVLGNAQTSHLVRVNDPYKEINIKLAGGVLFAPEAVNVLEQKTQLLSLKDDEFTHILPSVTVHSTEQDYKTYEGKCTDYVCAFNILNCRNHPFGGTKPFNGEVYLLSTGGVVTYKGNCGEDKTAGKFLPVGGIAFSKEFYASDYSKFNPPDPELLSTVFWNHSVLIKDGEAIVSFYTGDLTGRFRIVAQGTTGDDVMYGEKVFTVKPN